MKQENYRNVAVTLKEGIYVEEKERSAASRAVSRNVWGGI